MSRNYPDSDKSDNNPDYYRGANYDSDYYHGNK